MNRLFDLQTRNSGKHQNLTPRRLGSIFLVGFLLLGISVAVHAGKRGKPKPPPPPPPPVQYQITYLDDIRPRDINDSGIAVGNSGLLDGSIGGTVAMMAVPNGLGAWDTIDLNTLGATWTNLDTGGFTSDWIATHAWGINEPGQITGRAVNVVTGEYRPYLLEQDAILDWHFTLMPATGQNTGPTAINDQGVIIAGSSTVVYTPWAGYSPTFLGSLGSIFEINDFGVIVTSAGDVVFPTTYFPDGTYEYTPGVFQSFPDLTLLDINDSGIAVGSRPAVVVGKGRKQQVIPGGLVTLDTLTGAETLLVETSSATGWTINDYGDIAWTSSQASYLYISVDEQSGSYAIDDLVILEPGDDRWINGFSILRDINNDGTICGHGGTGDDFNAYILTPVP